jgi:hypothetical protein
MILDQHFSEILDVFRHPMTLGHLAHLDLLQIRVMDLPEHRGGAGRVGRRGASAAQQAKKTAEPNTIACPHV